MSTSVLHNPPSDPAEFALVHLRAHDPGAHLGSLPAQYQDEFIEKHRRIQSLLEDDPDVPRIQTRNLRFQPERDPTQTTTLRRGYLQTFSRKYRNLRGLIRQTIVENDAFNIQGLIDQQRNQKHPGQFNVDPLTRDDLFRWPTREGKEGGFLDWLQRAQAEEVLEFSGQFEDFDDISFDDVQPGHWQNARIRQAYRKGAKDAENRLRRQGIDVSVEDVSATITRPIHARQLFGLFERNFELLKTVQQAGHEEIAETIRQTLTDGLARGQGAQKIARRMTGAATDRISKTMFHRSKMIARTEIIKSHADATILRYQQLGVDTLAGKAEWSTAGDARVCPICIGMQGTLHKLEDARGLIPIHPNCRCTWVPVIAGEEGGGPGGIPPGSVTPDFPSSPVPNPQGPSYKRIPSRRDDVQTQAQDFIGDELDEQPNPRSITWHENRQTYAQEVAGRDGVSVRNPAFNSFNTRSTPDSLRGDIHYRDDVVTSVDDFVDDPFESVTTDIDPENLPLGLKFKLQDIETVFHETAHSLGRGPWAVRSTSWTKEMEEGMNEVVTRGMFKRFLKNSKPGQNLPFTADEIDDVVEEIGAYDRYVDRVRTLANEAADRQDDDPFDIVARIHQTPDRIEHPLDDGGPRMQHWIEELDPVMKQRSVRQTLRNAIREDGRFSMADANGVLVAQNKVKAQIGRLLNGELKTAQRVREEMDNFIEEIRDRFEGKVDEDTLQLLNDAVLRRMD